MEGFKAKKTEVLSQTEKFKTKEGESVTLKWCVFNPKTESQQDPVSGNLDNYIVFLPGVAVEADSPSVAKSAQDFANASQSVAYSISTRIDNPKAKDSQAAQAEAISQFLSLQNLQDITIVGNSQGANKAIDLTAQIEAREKDGKPVLVKGIILTNPAGLYDQDPAKLTKNFFKDAAVNTPNEVVKQGKSKLLASTISLGNSVAKNIAKEFINHPKEFKDRVTREADEAARLNVHAKDIKAPIVVVVGSKDLAFEAKDLIPEGAHDPSLDSQEKRVAEMRKIFPNSEDIKVLEVEKSGTHSLHFLRSESVANSTIGLLERMEKKRKNEIEDINKRAA